jgi:hypothetical protein
VDDAHLSPSNAPPLVFDDGSTAITPTVLPDRAPGRDQRLHRERTCRRPADR